MKRGCLTPSKSNNSEELFVPRLRNKAKRMPSVPEASVPDPNENPPSRTMRLPSKTVKVRMPTPQSKYEDDEGNPMAAQHHRTGLRECLANLRERWKHQDRTVSMHLTTKVVAVITVVALVLNTYIRTYPFFHGCRWSPGAQLRILAFGDPQITGAHQFTSMRKKIDIFGNDLFLKHTVSTLSTHLRPEYTIVLGDLVSNQWIGDDEFYARAKRYAKIFKKASESSQLFNVSGNHDIGYHGEMTHERVERFQHNYGSVNFVKTFMGDKQPWRIVCLNSLSLDPGPKDKYYYETHTFLDTLASTEFTGQTVLILHLPLYKPEGYCSDGPGFEYYPDSQNIRGQNHLSKESSLKVLESLFKTQSGVILAGHDHEGCKASYTINKTDPKGFEVYNTLQGRIQEYTVRSVMGEFGGNGGLLSGLYNTEDSAWQFEYSLCPFRVQHWWWITQILTLISLGLWTLWFTVKGWLVYGSKNTSPAHTHKSKTVSLK